MSDCKIQYKNSRFINQKIELDGKFFSHCQFEGCLIVLEIGETGFSGCTLKNCKLMLKGNAYTVGKIIKIFARDNPLQVLEVS